MLKACFFLPLYSLSEILLLFIWDVQGSFPDSNLPDFPDPTYKWHNYYISFSTPVFFLFFFFFFLMLRNKYSIKLTIWMERLYADFCCNLHHCSVHCAYNWHWSVNFAPVLNCQLHFATVFSNHSFLLF